MLQQLALGFPVYISKRAVWDLRVIHYSSLISQVNLFNNF